MKYLKKFENWGGEKEVTPKNQNLVDEHGREYDDDEEFEDESDERETDRRKSQMRPGDELEDESPESDEDY
jgi:hypothetical protein